MQLREVGKLAVHLWKMQWLQRPKGLNCERPHGCGQGFGPVLWLWGSPEAGESSLATGGHPLRQGQLLHVMCELLATWLGPNLQWLMWNCCCTGESNCLIET